MSTSFDDALNEFPDPHAAVFCRAFHRMVHLLDSLFDRDEDRTADDVALTFYAFIGQVAGNPFFAQHRDALLPIIYTSAKSWAASERLRKSADIQEQIASEVIKSNYQDIYHYVAFLCGGIEFAAEWDIKHRGYYFG